MTPEEEAVAKLHPAKQRRMAMLSLAGVRFGIERVTANANLWAARWWDGGRERRRYSHDLHDLIGNTYNVVPQKDD